MQGIFVPLAERFSRGGGAGAPSRQRKRQLTLRASWEFPKAGDSIIRQMHNRRIGGGVVRG